MSRSSSKRRNLWGETHDKKWESISKGWPAGVEAILLVAYMDSPCSVTPGLPENTLRLGLMADVVPKRLVDLI